MSEPANGNNTVILLARETVWGVENASPAPFQLLIEAGGGVIGDQTLIANELLGADPNPRDAVVGKQSASGDFVFYPNVKSAPYLAEFMLGTRNTTGSGTYTHKSKLVAGSMPSWTTDEKLDMSTPKYLRGLGFRVDKATVEFASEGFLKWKCAMLGKGTTWQAAQLAGTPVDATSGAGLEFFDNLMLAAADVKLNGSAIAQIVSGSIEINHNHFPDHYVAGGGGVRRSLPRRRATVNGKISTFLEDDTVHALAVAGTYVALDLKWTHDSTTIQILVPRVRLKVTDPKIANGPLQMDFEFMGSKDTSEATAVEIITVNTIAGTVYDV